MIMQAIPKVLVLSGVGESLIETKLVDVAKGNTEICNITRTKPQ